MANGAFKFVPSSVRSRVKRAAQPLRDVAKLPADGRNTARELRKVLEDERQATRELKKALADARQTTRELNQALRTVKPPAERQRPQFEIEMMPLPFGRGKPRVLLFHQGYPTFSETYMHEEIASLSEDYDIRIISFWPSSRPRRRAWQYNFIPGAPNLAYASLAEITAGLETDKHQSFLARVERIIEEFKPDVIHTHYLPIALLVQDLAEKHRVPFTIRTHSFDILGEAEDKTRAAVEACNSPWCLRVLAFPESRKRLIEHGMNPEKVVSCWPAINFSAFYKPDARPPTGRILCSGPALDKKAHKDFVDLAVMMRDSGYQFDLYARGPSLDETRAYNEAKGSPVRIDYADPEEMPDVYPRYDWMFYPGDPTISRVGLPVGIPEAQASGLGVIWQEYPGRRQEQLDFLGGGGFLYQAVNEAVDILKQPYPEEMRQAGFEAARRCDIEQHKHLLSDVWNSPPVTAEAVG